MRLNLVLHFIQSRSESFNLLLPLHEICAHDENQNSATTDSNRCLRTIRPSGKSGPPRLVISHVDAKPEITSMNRLIVAAIRCSLMFLLPTVPYD
jgi:hypothetical protein